MKVFGALLFVFSLFLAGCGASLEKRIAGTWKVNMGRSELGQKKDPQQAEIEKKVAEQMYLELKEDQTFDFKFMILFHGKWAVDKGANKVVLTLGDQGQATTFGGKNTIDLTMEDGGQTLVLAGTDPKSPGKLSFTKS